MRLSSMFYVGLLCFGSAIAGQQAALNQNTAAPVTLPPFTADQNHQNMMDQLGIKGSASRAERR